MAGAKMARLSRYFAVIKVKYRFVMMARCWTQSSNKNAT
jgi:hypothetical protein